MFIVRQCICDEQFIILFELCRIFQIEGSKKFDSNDNTGYGNSYIDNSRHLNKRSTSVNPLITIAAFPALILTGTVPSIKQTDGWNYNKNPSGNQETFALTTVPGNIFTNVPMWANAVEDVVVRISVILDDWLYTHVMPPKSNRDNSQRLRPNSSVVSDNSVSNV